MLPPTPSGHVEYALYNKKERVSTAANFKVKYMKGEQVVQIPFDKVGKVHLLRFPTGGEC
jgi:hypothetical protein